MNDPMDQFFGIGSDGQLNSHKDDIRENDMDVTGNASAMDGGSVNPHDADPVFDIEVIIPIDAKLSDITVLALDAYKQQIDILKHIEPKYRNRGFEVAQQYLTIAQNAIKQDVELGQKRDKMILDRDKANLGDKKDVSQQPTKDNLYKLVNKMKHEA